jgi:peptidoglycan/LPS O-acetylase OafA/YrhL
MKAVVNKPLLRHQMPELNVLRCFACLAVLCYHGLWAYTREAAAGTEGWIHNLTSGGHYGVNLFFVLSGMLITNILLESRDRPDYFQRFYKRRVLRILPPYYMMIALLALYGISPRFLGLSLLHIANMAQLLGVPLAFGPFWSLAVEEQFYLVWPLFVRKLRTRPLVVVLLGVFAASAALGFERNPDPRLVFTTWHQSHSLALGTLLAIFLRSTYGTRRNAGLLAAALAGIGGFALVSPLQAVAWEMIFAAVLLGAMLLGTTRFARWTRPRPLLFLGDISYGLYLVHILVFALYRHMVFVSGSLGSILTQFVVCSAVSTLLATVSRFSVEEWFLGLKDKRLFPKIAVSPISPPCSL